MNRLNDKFCKKIGWMKNFHFVFNFNFLWQIFHEIWLIEIFFEKIDWLIIFFWENRLNYKFFLGKSINCQIFWGNRLIDKFSVKIDILHVWPIFSWNFVNFYEKIDWMSNFLWKWNEWQILSKNRSTAKFFEKTTID